MLVYVHGYITTLYIVQNEWSLHHRASRCSSTEHSGNNDTMQCNTILLSVYCNCFKVHSNYGACNYTCNDQ